MVKHYFKVTFRHIRKHILISILNIAGLAIGIACFILIMLYVNYELDYDKFNEHYDDIYRIGVFTLDRRGIRTHHFRAAGNDVRCFACQA